MTRDESLKLVDWRVMRIDKSGRSTVSENMGELFFLDEAKGTQNFSLGSVWMTFSGHALVAINRYKLAEREIEAFVVKDISGTAPDQKPNVAWDDYQKWVKDVPMTFLKEEYQIDETDWKPIAPEDIHHKALQWLADQISGIVNDRLTGG